jgi:hypothetical protein
VTFDPVDVGFDHTRHESVEILGQLFLQGIGENVDGV